MEKHQTIENDRPLSPRNMSSVGGPHTQCAFDAEYVSKLTAGDPATETHFVEYFSGLLFAKLRFHLRLRQDIQDFQQEVFLRVLRSLRQGEGLRQPERLGAYVNSVCSNILFEHFRHKGRVVQFKEDAPEPRDWQTDLERDLVAEETRSRVRALIGELAPRDRNILRAAVLEERQVDSVCREFGVSKGHLRVLLHRARQRFRRLTYAREAVSTDC
jgi:RNA polymerase sigma-70 factor, ECF subfamily